MSPRKISATQRRDFAGPRRKIPLQNRRKTAVKRQLADEAVLVDLLMEDAAIRRAFERGMGLRSAPGSVWQDSDHSGGLTTLAPKHLPTWDQLSEAMKMFIAWDAGMEINSAYALNLNLKADDVKRWDASSLGLMGTIEQRMRRTLARSGLKDLPFAYVVETRSKSGRTPVAVHLHGMALCDVPQDATTFKVAMERAFVPNLAKVGRQRAAKVEPGYDPLAGLEFVDRDRWLSYIIKNVHRYDRRLSKRRLFLSHSLTQCARDA